MLVKESGDMLVKTLACDGEFCKKFRMNDTNHWWFGRVLNSGTIMVGLLTGEGEAGAEGLSHFCGEQCMTKWFLGEVAKLGG